DRRATGNQPRRQQIVFFTASRRVPKTLRIRSVAFAAPCKYRFAGVPYSLIHSFQWWRHCAVVLIEWGERFPQLLPAERIEIRLEPYGETGRTITVTAPPGFERKEV